MEVTITIVLDGILFTMGAIAAVLAWTVLGGRIGDGLKIGATGLVFLSLVHILETVLGISFGFEGEGAPELIHRVLVLFGFLWLVYGLSRVRAAFS
ncbi:MAG: hypothetical protein ACE5KW_03490 [Dehalococcoidia bacterium]